MHTVITQLQDLAKASPYEICGVIGSDFTIHPIRNVAKNPTNCFIFDKKEYFTLIKKFKEDGCKVICIYHSHPNGDVTPSQADLNYTKNHKIPQIIVSGSRFRLVENA